MPLQGKIKNLFSNKERTEALFPRTKTKAVTDEEGKSLDKILEDKATHEYVREKIAEAQLPDKEVDLSDYITKDQFLNINFPVTSVNEKVGEINLSAKDVGALPSSGGALTGDLTIGEKVAIWSDSEGGNLRISPPNDTGTDYWDMDSFNGDNFRFYAVKNSTNPNGEGYVFPLILHTDGSIEVENTTKTRERLGAAPAGYGLGEVSTSPNDLNATMKNGYFRVTSSVTNFPFTHGAGQVRSYNTSEAVQNIVQTTTGNEMIRYTTDGGATWVEEWVNPPLALNVEYRTTERWYGYPVYIKLIDMGALPNNSTKSVQVFDNVTGGRVIEAHGFENLSGQKIPTAAFGANFNYRVELPFSGKTLTIFSNFDGSAYTQALITVKYIKY